MATSNGGSENDTLALVFLAVVGAPTLSGALIVYWHQVVGWAVGAGVLVPASAHPLVTLPQTTAGLDLPRLAIAAAVVALVLMVPVMLIRRAWLQRQVIQ
jgi:hypothetical protein